jgi:hypothetical protein
MKIVRVAVLLAGLALVGVSVLADENPSIRAEGAAGIGIDATTAGRLDIERPCTE